MDINLNFKSYLEMSHLKPTHDGKLAPFLFDGGYVATVDMKFETYPDKELKNKLLLSNRVKFFAQIPNQHNYLVFDGNHLDTSHNIPNPAEYIRLPDNWFRFAVFEFIDGSVKEPS